MSDTHSLKQIFIPLVSCLLLTFPAPEALANIPFRVSVKFIVDADGNRPAVGTFNSTEDVNDKQARANDVLSNMLSELQMEITEIIDLPAALSTYDSTSIDPTGRNLIRDLALADPDTWLWRTDAVNVYVIDGSGPFGAYSNRPPDNNIVLMGQGVNNETFLHELGHSLDLTHTHVDDLCADTILDDPDWNNIDEMANANFGKDYSLLTVDQQNSVDMTWFNIMSYHLAAREYLTPCQIDRASATASDDDDWLLSKTPLYVHPANSAASCGTTISCNGSWARPFPDLQTALGLGDSALSGKAIVLEKSNYTMTPATGVNVNVGVYSRQGTSRIDNEPALYALPTKASIPDSAVDIALKAAQREATLGRKALMKGKSDAAAAPEKNRAAITANARKTHRQHNASVIKHLVAGERHASGRARHAIQMELGQRYRQSGNYQQCLVYYKRVAADTEQAHLKTMALQLADKCKEKISKHTKSE